LHAGARGVVRKQFSLARVHIGPAKHDAPLITKPSVPVEVAGQGGNGVALFRPERYCRFAWLGVATEQVVQARGALWVGSVRRSVRALGCCGALLVGIEGARVEPRWSGRSCGSLASAKRPSLGAIGTDEGRFRSGRLQRARLRSLAERNHLQPARTNALSTLRPQKHEQRP
jgi:hypothetical protein